MTKRKTPFFFTFKGLSNSPIFQYLNFSFHRHFKRCFMVILMLLPAAAYDGIRVDLNDTHFTVVCRKNPNFYALKIILVVLPVQYLLPGIFITYIRQYLLDKNCVGQNTGAPDVVWDLHT